MTLILYFSDDRGDKLSEELYLKFRKSKVIEDLVMEMKEQEVNKRGFKCAKKVNGKMLPGFGILAL